MDLNLAKLLGYDGSMVKVGIGELRDRVSQYVRRAERGETIVIVNRDREVAVLQPWREKRPRSRRLMGSMKGTAKISGDIVKPVIPKREWFRS
jgi:prevent-host-death family protein